MLCEHYASCEFIEIMSKSDSLTADTVRITYCEHDKYGCARYSLLQVLGADDVPDFIWPNDEDEALELIKFKTRQMDKCREDRTS